MTVLIPGSYDPVTLGHVDLIRRAAEKYDGVYAVVFQNAEKHNTFSVEDRVRMLILATEEFDNVIVSHAEGLTVDYMRDHGIDKFVKGVRNETDVAYEDVIARFNYEHGGYETEYLPADPALADVSSTLARRLIAEGGDLSGVLPPAVIEFLKTR